MPCVVDVSYSMHRRDVLRAGGALGAVCLAGCLGGETPRNPTAAGDTLRLATTTSTYTSGVLEELHAGFEQRFGIAVDAIPQGTGAALETGRNGDVDVVMVHAREQEDAFVRERYGTNRRDVMLNDFVVVGPPDDPIDLRSVETIEAAFERIADQQPVFVSRGDNSGTHHREQQIWETVGIEPAGDWYRAVGSGMGQTLSHANLAGGAYTLSDRATYLSMRDEIDLAVSFEGDAPGMPPLLANPYGVIAVNPATHPHVAYDLAMAYIGYLTSPAGQDRIAAVTVDGEPLFVPAALDHAENVGQHVPANWTAMEGS